MRGERAAMPCLGPDERIGNFKEVELGLEEEDALGEAARCLRCPRPGCVEACPAGVDIPGFISRIRQRNYAEAAATIMESNPFPRVCGRVCPQEQHCEGSCILARTGNAVAVGALERFAGDAANGKIALKKGTQNSMHIAVVGAGPAGLGAAAELVARGFEITIFEAEEYLGGVMLSGIPEFRLPAQVVEDEIGKVRDAGVKLVKKRIGSDAIEGLAEEFDSVILATGAGTPQRLGIAGEGLAGVVSALDFLKDARNPKKSSLGKNAVVIGGGNVAMDAARSAVRLGCRATVAYRGAEQGMSARKGEVQHARDEGISFELGAIPRAFFGDSLLEGIVFAQWKKEVKMPAELAVVAIGQRPASLGAALATDNACRLVVNARAMTSVQNVFAAGDLVLGSSTLVEAIAGGRHAAWAIARRLAKK